MRIQKKPKIKKYQKPRCKTEKIKVIHCDYFGNEWFSKDSPDFLLAQNLDE